MTFNSTLLFTWYLTKSYTGLIVYIRAFAGRKATFQAELDNEPSGLSPKLVWTF